MRNVNEQYKGGEHGVTLRYQDGTPWAWVQPSPHHRMGGPKVLSASAEPGKKTVMMKVKNREGKISLRTLGGWSSEKEISDAAFSMSRPEITDIPSRQLKEEIFFETHYHAYKDILQRLFVQRRRLGDNVPMTAHFVRVHCNDFLERIHQERGIQITP